MQVANTHSPSALKSSSQSTNAQQDYNKYKGVQKQLNSQEDGDFSMEYDQLLESIQCFQQQIQGQAYSKVKNACEIMRKFIVLQEFKSNIDSCWDTIKEKMLEFLNIDKNMIQFYSQLKSKLNQYLNKFQQCQNMQSLRQKISSMQQIDKIKVTKSKTRLKNSQQLQIQQKIFQWEQCVNQIEYQQQIIKDYGMKIIELVTQKPQKIKINEDQAEKKMNAKSYFQLRQKIQSKLNCQHGQVLSQSSQQWKVQDRKQSENQASTQKNQSMESIKPFREISFQQNIFKQNDSVCRCKKQKQSNILIKKILDLYKE